MAGIGCHFMATWMDRSTIGFTQMGGEGVPWVGQQPFTTDQHIFANLGDGTYFHSGLLAIRQSHRGRREHHLQDPLQRRGRHDRRPAGRRAARRPLGAADRRRACMPKARPSVVIVTDEPEKYDGAPSCRPAWQVHHRDELDDIQREFREIKGTTAIIYDQTCATEKRRRRKRGTAGRSGRARGHQRAGVRRLRRLQRAEQLPVGRAAGDRVRPQAHHQPEHLQQGHELPQGLLPELRHRRRRPAEEEGQGARRSRRSSWAQLPEPRVAAPSHGAWGIVVAGVGGTGVITIGQLLGMAAPHRGQGHRHAGRRRPGAKGRRHLEPCADRRHAGRHPHDARRHGRRRPRSSAAIRSSRPASETRAAHARRPHACGAQLATARRRRLSCKQRQLGQSAGRLRRRDRPCRGRRRACRPSTPMRLPPR